MKTCTWSDWTEQLTFLLAQVSLIWSELTSLLFMSYFEKQPPLFLGTTLHFQKQTHKRKEMGWLRSSESAELLHCKWKWEKCDQRIWSWWAWNPEFKNVSLSWGCLYCSITSWGWGKLAVFVNIIWIIGMRWNQDGFLEIPQNPLQSWGLPQWFKNYHFVVTVIYILIISMLGMLKIIWKVFWLFFFFANL